MSDEAPTPDAGTHADVAVLMALGREQRAHALARKLWSKIKLVRDTQRMAQEDLRIGDVHDEKTPDIDPPLGPHDKPESWPRLRVEKKVEEGW